MGNSRHNPRARSFLPYDTSQGMTLRDAFGRILTEQDEVIVPKMKIEAPRLVVAAIRPNLAPQAPPNTLQVVLVAQIVLTVPANTPIGDMIQTRNVDERIEAGEIPPGPGTPPSPHEIASEAEALIAADAPRRVMPGEDD